MRRTETSAPPCFVLRRGRWAIEASLRRPCRRPSSGPGERLIDTTKPEAPLASVAVLHLPQRGHRHGQGPQDPTRHGRWQRCGRSRDRRRRRCHREDACKQRRSKRPCAGWVPAHRQVLTEVVILDRPQDAVAADLGVPVGTVKSRVFYGLRSLRKSLEAIGWSDD